MGICFLIIAVGAVEKVGAAIRARGIATESEYMPIISKLFERNGEAKAG